MTPVCGFKDSQGRFWDKEEECKMSEINIRLRDIEYMFLHNNELVYYSYNYYTKMSTKRHRIDHENIRVILDIIREFPDLFMEFAKLSKELALSLPNPEILPHNPDKPWWKFW